MGNTQNIIIRKMTAEDIDAVHQIEELSITPPWTKQGFADGLANENAVFYVAEVCALTEPDCRQHENGKVQKDGSVVGYCGLYFAADEGEITNVAVHPDWRKRGIADQILDAVLADACERNLAQIFLEVRASNDPAKKLYEKHGFESQGIRKNFYREPKEDAIVMSCRV